MKSKLVTVLLFMMGSSAPLGAQERPQPPDYQVCEGTFALCTTAQCNFGTAQDQNVECLCTVNTGYSAGGQGCSPPEPTPQGTRIYSRFFPIASYQTCQNQPSNTSPWAWCLDKPCLIDQNNPTVARCTCGRVATTSYNRQPSYPYIIVTGRPTPSLCQNGINYSSATTTDVNNITEAFNLYLQKNNPYPVSIPTALQSK